MKKKLLLLFTFLCLFLSVSILNTYASNDIKNTLNNIKQARLIEEYIVKYKNDIKKLKTKYEIVDSEIIRENFRELDKIIWGLRKIQSKNIDKYIAERIIKEVVKNLKIINNNLKLYLKIKKEESKENLKIKKIAYIKLAKKINSKIKSLIKRIVIILKSKNKLTIKQKKILKHLVKLEKESKYLSSMDKQVFENSTEIKNYLLNIIKNIRKEIKGIKDLLK